MTAVPQSGPITNRPLSKDDFFINISSSKDTLSLYKKTFLPKSNASNATSTAYRPGTEINTQRASGKLLTAVIKLLGRKS